MSFDISYKSVQCEEEEVEKYIKEWLPLNWVDDRIDFAQFILKQYMYSSEFLRVCYIFEK